MKVVWKYTFPILDELTLPLLLEDEILSVQMKDDKACMWVLTDPKSKETYKDKNYTRKF